MKWFVVPLLVLLADLGVAKEELEVEEEE